MPRALGKLPSHSNASWTTAIAEAALSVRGWALDARLPAFLAGLLLSGGLSLLELVPWHVQ
jgi:hypothetical protein